MKGSRVYENANDVDLRLGLMSKSANSITRFQFPSSLFFSMSFSTTILPLGIFPVIVQDSTTTKIQEWTTSSRILAFFIIDVS